MPRLAPLPVGSVPELTDVFEHMKASGHFIPNSQLILHSDGPIGRIDAADVIKVINFREAQLRK